MRFGVCGTLVSSVGFAWALVLPTVPLVSACAAGEPPQRVIPQFPLGRETTVVEGPLDAEGYVDYAAALTAHYGRGVAPGENACAALWGAIGPREYRQRLPDALFRALGIEPPPEEGTYFFSFDEFYLEGTVLEDDARLALVDRFETSLRRPWTATDIPQVADWLDAQRIPLERISAATGRPKFFRPVVYGPIETTPDDDGKPRTRPRELMHALMPPTLGKGRDLVRALSCRAMLRLGEQDYDGAWSDLAAGLRLGRHVGNGPTWVEMLVGLTCERVACEAVEKYLALAPFPPDRARKIRADLAQFPSIGPAADRLDRAERYLVLDAVRRVHRGEPEAWESFLTGQLQPTPETIRELADADLAATLVEVNRWYDRYVAAASRPKFA